MLEAVRERHHRREDGDDEREAEDRRDRGDAAHEEPAQVDLEGDRHHPTFLSPTATGRRAAKKPGIAPLTNPIEPAIVRAMRAVPGDMPIGHQTIGSLNPRMLKMRRLPKHATAPAISEMRIDSASIVPRTLPGVKPSALRTATSVVRSRTAIAIVFAETMRI